VGIVWGLRVSRPAARGQDGRNSNGTPIDDVESTTPRERTMAEPLSLTVGTLHLFQIAVPAAEIPYDSPSRNRARAAVARLSAREREILPLLAARWTDREIATVLCISHRTVTTHVSHIFGKLGISSRREVVPFVVIAEEMSA
jgi:DNA-binding CsgD family transcriptional regulator